MAKATVPMVATKSKRYNRADLVPGKTFLAKPGDVKTLKFLGWAKDAPPPKPIKAATYQTAELKAAE